jgi:NADPH-dependent F420 reductase
MDIAIIGAGNVGGTLGRAWAGKGERIIFGVRDPNDATVRSLVGSSGHGARATIVRDAVAASDIVVLAVPWEAVDSVLASAGDVRGKLLIDATNPLKRDLSGLAVGHTTSGAEEIARNAHGANVVKAFNTIGFMHMADPKFGAERASMFLCGDDAAAKKTVAELAAALGFEAVDAGPLRQARLLEPLAMLWISMALVYGAGPNIAFRLLRK